MDHEWIVEVKDEKGAPVTNAKVAFVELHIGNMGDWPFTGVAATHAHTANGVYTASPPIVPTDNLWILIVQVTGKSPVTQVVKLKANAQGEVVTTPTPLDVGPSKLARAIQFVSEVKKVGTTTVRRVHFGVTVFPSTEIVLLSGISYHSTGEIFRRFAETYRGGLRSEKKIDDGTIVTMFSCDDRSREKFVAAAGGGWMQVDAVSFGSTAGITPGKNHPHVVGEDVSIVHLYHYLDEVGRAEPGRVKEVGIFSHSWPGGPILFNTQDLSPTDARDPDDFDPREKDFNGTNKPSWPDMDKAMAPKGKWHIWGCSATMLVFRQSVAAHQHKKDGEEAFFVVESVVESHVTHAVVEEIRERTWRARVAFEMDGRFRTHSYMATAVNNLGCSVFGAPPGVGSSFRASTMYIDTDAYAVSYAYFKDVFGPEFAPTNDPIDKGYVDYRAIQSRKPITQPTGPRSEYYMFLKDHRHNETLLIFYDGRQLSMTGTDITFHESRRGGLLFPNEWGWLYELNDTVDPTRSQKVYVQDNGRIFTVHVLPNGAGAATSEIQ